MMAVFMDEMWLAWSLILALAAGGLFMEKTSLGKIMSGTVVSILLGIFVSNMGILPHSSPVYDTVWNWLLPLGIPLLLFDANLLRIYRDSGPILIAFILGAIGSFMGNLIAYQLVPLGAEGWKMASVLTSSYIGGSVNYFSTAKALGLDQDASMLAAGAAADNLVMALYFIIIFMLPSMTWFRKYYPSRSRAEDGDALYLNGEERAVTSRSLLTALALSLWIGLSGKILGGIIPIAGAEILWITIMSVALATLLPKVTDFIRGYRELGMALMQIFFVVIGLSADVGTVLRVAPLLFAYIAIMLLVHLLFLLGAGRFFKLGIREIVMASNANCGGPTTAAAMGISKDWPSLVVPSILCGTLGYACANFAGLAMAWLLAT